MKRLGSYEVVKELGRGAMGVVYEVRGAEGERLAAKVLLRPHSGAMERFRREAEVLRFLGRHPQIVGYRDAGMQGASPYIVMDFVEGRTLAHALQAGLPRERAIAILAKAARALHFAHEAEVVHRDFKPANVLLDADDRPLLSDFGVAKSLRADRLTVTGELVGTPAYMAPEQLDAREVDRRTDVYALGAVLYEILGGERPFRGPSVTVMKQILIDPPPPLPEDVPSDLAGLALRCLAKDPAERPATAEDVARALEVEPVEAVAPRSPRTAAVVGALCLLVGLGTGWASRGAPASSEDAATRVTLSGPTPRRDLDTAKDPRAWCKAQADRTAPTTDAAAWGLLEDLRAVARHDAWALVDNPKLAEQLKTSAELLLDSVDPTRADDAVLVHGAWDALLLAKLSNSSFDPSEALGRFDRFRIAEAKAVRDAASPWRDLFGRSIVPLEARYVERALKMKGRAGWKDKLTLTQWKTYPPPWGAVVHQVRRATSWWQAYVDLGARCRVMTELYLRRPDLPFLAFVLAEDLQNQGRRSEAHVLFTRATKAVAAKVNSETSYRVGVYLADWSGDADSGAPYLAEAIDGGSNWARLHLAGAMNATGTAERARGALSVLTAVKGLQTHWRWQEEVRRALERTGGEVPPGLRGAYSAEAHAKARAEAMQGYPAR